MVSEDRRVPEGVDPSKPNAARVYDYLLGGKDNYEVDRMLADRMLAVAPDNRTLAWFSRQFLLQAVRLAAESGIRQFLDIGAGIPTSPSVHEVAQKVDPDARVVSIDYDPVVYAHTNGMLSGIPGVTPMLADARDPDIIIERSRAEAGIDFQRPVAILLVGVLHFIMDDERPDRMIARYRDAMASGSYFAFTHGSVESDEEFVNQTLKATVGSTAQFVFRSRAKVRTFLDGFEILEPGVVPLQDWLGGDLPPTVVNIMSGLCRKP
ncbi:SAM-dependent methyltransferase [Nocardia pseudobrasiliensis]|uniref:S-adenosyl methyltransferase n=1 Tax=Nocardia pseudobrasiliensis TaxID=45979 RepID=A0A370IAW5_9NOCA|nr:SAM-dependent methyltransferase [Nocardia pseudobrasiliensis]RDI67750.1 S-adenosyl methyltransferase [Nocardia pseudobrasiliensis]